MTFLILSLVNPTEKTVMVIFIWWKPKTTLVCTGNFRTSWQEQRMIPKFSYTGQWLFCTRHIFLWELVLLNYDSTWTVEETFCVFVSPPLFFFFFTFICLVVVVVVLLVLLLLLMMIDWSVHANLSGQTFWHLETLLVKNRCERKLGRCWRCFTLFSTPRHALSDREQPMHLISFCSILIFLSL